MRALHDPMMLSAAEFFPDAMAMIGQLSVLFFRGLSNKGYP
jgi:hypothetical protein